jgi:5-methylcytosine-specific restriction endonuclease McrA
MSEPSSELRNALVTRYRYSAEMVDLAWRARFCCEYCDKDLLRSVDEYEWHWEHDHVVPTNRGGPDRPENWALACRTCNQFKGAWDPRTEAAGREDRDVLVAVTRAYVQRRRTERGRELDEVRSLILAEMQR